MGVIKVEGGSIRYSRREHRRFWFDKDWWVVDEPYHLYTDEEGHLIVPTGFEIDGASVPWIFRRLLPKMSEYNPIIVFHDYLYRHKGVAMWYVEDGHGSSVAVKRFIDRPRADVLLRDGMKYLDVGAWKIPLMFGGVRAFGGGPWQNTVK